MQVERERERVREFWRKLRRKFKRKRERIQKLIRREREWERERILVLFLKRFHFSMQQKRVPHIKVNGRVNEPTQFYSARALKVVYMSAWFVVVVVVVLKWEEKQTDGESRRGISFLACLWITVSLLAFFVMTAGEASTKVFFLAARWHIVKRRNVVVAWRHKVVKL